MSRLVRLFIRISSFVRKEIFEVLRQPRLVLALVLGPFLILLLFGAGYRAEARALRTIFVVAEGSPLGDQIEEYAPSLGQQLIFEGIANDEVAARERLRRREVDLVVVAPPNAYETVRNNQQAVFTLYHNEIDPFQADYVKYFGQIYVSEVNRRVLRSIAEQGQSEASTVQDDLAAARASASAMREALERQDVPSAQQEQRNLDRNLSAVELAVGATLGLLGGVEGTIGSGGDTEADEIRQSLTDVRESATSLSEIEEDRDEYNAELERVRQIEEDLTLLESRLSAFQRVDPQVLVSPFGTDTQSIATLQPRISDYFAPSVIVLLLQHLGITLAALSFVRERQLGTMELFRVSPLSSIEALLGKYISYLLFGGILAAILTAVMIFALGVPMLGRWDSYALVMLALLFSSLGLGFVMSLVAQTDTQAVQYSMIALLASVFFSGFFLGLEALLPQVRVVSWALPATYAILLLQNIMLRGYVPDPTWLAWLAGIGAVLFLLAQLLLRRSMGRT